MSEGEAAIKGAKAGDALRDWQAMRHSPDIQFGELKLTPPRNFQPPAWLEALGNFFKKVFGPLGEALGMSWPVLVKLLIGLAVLAVLLLVWRLLAPLLGARKVKVKAPDDWAPDETEALALLEDADQLAAAGRYDEAAHLLLQRSVGQISAARPDLLGPANTAREIAALPALPERAREAFAVIAGRVERGLYALVPLDRTDWEAARGAYARFAVAGLGE